MNRVRLTREQSRDQTRQHLLDAAVKMFVQKGLSATRIEDIVEAAGYTRGAFYSNFDSKAELFIEVLERDLTATLYGINLPPAQGDAEASPVRQLARRILQRYSDEASLLLWVEAKIQAVRDPVLNKTLSRLETVAQQATLDCIEQRLVRSEHAHSISAAHVVRGLSLLCESLRLAHLHDAREMSNKVIADFVEETCRHFFLP